MENLDKNEKALVNLLPVGCEHPRSARELAKLLQLNDRAVRRLINHLATQHHLPIGSKSGEPAGYYWIVSENERSLSIDQLNSQVESMVMRIKATSACQLITKHAALNNNHHSA